MNPQDGYISYIINPKSGARCTKLAGQNFQKYLLDKGFDVRVNITKSLEHACKLATDAAVDYQCAMVVAVGGDGTIREIAHGLEGSDKPLLIVPGGTENLLANELGLDEKLKTLIDTFNAGCIKPFDLGSVNGKCFTSIAGFGFDGTVVKTVSQNRTGHIDHFDYFWPIWRTFWGYKFDDMAVNVDGEDIFSGPAMVFVGNISRYAIGLEILHNADYSDGLLDICIYKCDSKPRLTQHAIMTLSKRHSNSKNVIYKQGKTVTIKSNAGKVDSQIDGDPGPDLPVEIKIIPHAVKVMIPENAKPAGIRKRLLRAIG